MVDNNNGSVVGEPVDSRPGPLDDFPLDTLGQQPLLKIYTQICFCFPIPDDKDAATNRQRAIDTLANGLKRLAKAFPWTAGQVVEVPGSPADPSDHDQTCFAIKELEATPRFVVRDLTSSDALDNGTGGGAPTWSDLVEADFPVTLLDESLIAPINTLPPPSFDVYPVLEVQATLIRGGLILCFAAHHATMDMVGQGAVISLFSRACEGDDFTQDELDIGNMCRRDVVPSLDDETYEALGPKLIEAQTIPPPVPKAEADTGGGGLDHQDPPPKAVWGYFSFSPAALSAVKAYAMQTLPPRQEGEQSFVSTDDALTALTWQATVRARLVRMTDFTRSSLARAVNVRPYLSMPSMYPGLLQSMTYHDLPAEELAQKESLGLVSSNLRAALDPDNASEIAMRTRALATFMRRTKDRSVISLVARVDLSKGLMLSSWAGIPAYHMSFGMGLGLPTSVRRPGFFAVESLVYHLPRTREGGITVMLALREDDMQALKRDEEWMKYAKIIEEPGSK